MIRTNFGKKRVVYYLPLVMTNDPSMTAWGWAILDKFGKVCASGAIKTKPIEKKLRIRVGDDNIRRITEINTELLRIIDEYNPALIVSELPSGGSQSAIAATMLGFVTAILQTIAIVKDIPIEWFSEGDAKMAVCGKRSIEKNEMVLLMRKKNSTMPFLNVKWRDQAVADSLAVYYAAKKQSSILRLLTKK